MFNSYYSDSVLARILIVDDDAHRAQRLSSALIAEEGPAISVAISRPRHALTLLAETAPHILIAADGGSSESASVLQQARLRWPKTLRVLLTEGWPDRLLTAINEEKVDRVFLNDASEAELRDGIASLFNEYLANRQAEQGDDDEREDVSQPVFNPLLTRDELECLREFFDTPQSAGTFTEESPAHVSAILNACCDCHSPATILLPDAGTVVSGRFIQLGPEGMLIRTNTVPGHLPVTYGSCVVTFNQLVGGAAFFSSSIERCSAVAGGSELWIRFPSLISKVENRRTPRIPVRADSGLRISLTECDEGRSVEAMPVDISLSGLLIEDITEGAPLPLSARVSVRLTLHGKTTTLEGEVKRRAGRRYGLHFPKTIEHDQIVAPQPYCEIIDQLERDWLRSVAC